MPVQGEQGEQGEGQDLSRRVAVLALSLVFGACLSSGTPRFAAASAESPIDWEAHLDLVQVSRTDQINSNFFSFAENPFHAIRLRLLADGRIQEHISAFAEILSDDGRAPRLYGGFVRFSDPKGRDIHLEAGKIPMHVGAFPNRSDASRNNLIGSPLVYQYHLDVRDDQVPVRPEDIVANQGRGYFTNYAAGGLTGLGYPGTGQALSVLYENCWDVGAVVVGTARPFEFALGATNGTVGSMVSTDDNDGKQLLGRVGLAPAPWVRAGVSAARGPYLSRALEDGALPARKNADDYNQVFAGGDLELSYDRAVVYGEYVWNRFEQPWVGDLDLRAWYAEGKVTVLPGWYVAGRYSRVAFDDLTLAGGRAVAWDAPIWRREIGIGFKPSKMLLAKLVHQETHTETVPRRVEAFMAAQLAVVF